MSYFPSLTQNVLIDANNTYSQSVASLATYTPAAGTSSALVSGIQFTVKSTQNFEIYVDQGEDPTFATYVRDTYQYNVLKGNFGLTVQSISTYVRISAKNKSGTTATVNVSTVLCPIVEAVPRSLGESVQGFHLNVGVQELGDRWGNEIQVSPSGWMGINQPYRLVGTAFGAAIDTNFWTATLNTNGGSGGASGVANSIATISSGIGTNAWAQIRTVREARFIFNNALKTKQLILIPTVVAANTNRYWGAFTATAGSAGVLPTVVDGFYFALDGAGVLSVNSRNSGGTVNSISSGAFNGEISNYTVDTNVHAYEIVYYVAKCQFYIDDVLVHTFKPTITILTATCTLPLGALATTSATNDGTIQMWAGTIHRLGRDITNPTYKHYTGATPNVAIKLGAGTLRSVTVNSWVSGTTLSLFDSATTTNPIAVIAITAGIQPALAPFTLNYGLDFYIGLAITITGTMDVTIIYE